MIDRRMNAQARKLAYKLDEDVEKKVRKLAVDIHRSTVLKTPVDTGRLRNNWWVSSFIPKVMNGAEGFGLNLLKRGSGRGSVYIVNTMPYAKKIEHGGSQQAPNGMLFTTIALVMAANK